MDLDASNNNSTETEDLSPTTSELINIFSNYLNSALLGNTSSNATNNSILNYYNYPNNTNMALPSTYIPENTFFNNSTNINSSNATDISSNTTDVSSNATENPENNFYIRFVEDLLSLPPLPINLTPPNEMESLLQTSLNDKSAYKNVLSKKGEKDIKKIKYNADQSDIVCCPITQVNFTENQEVSQLPCGHIFDSSAIKIWLENEKAECPCCRFKLDSVEKKNEEEISYSQNETLNRNALFSRPRRRRNANYRLRNFIMMQDMIQEEDDLQTALMASLEEQYMPDQTKSMNDDTNDDANDNANDNANDEIY
jgi:hypothetical protein